MTADSGSATSLPAGRKPAVAIVGASRDPSKFGNISVRAHLRRGYDVYPVNPQASQIEGLPCFASIRAVPVPLDRVSVYLPPQLTLALLDELRELNAGEIWLNPGSADGRVRRRAEELGLTTIEACSIVDLGLSPGSV